MNDNTTMVYNLFACCLFLVVVIVLMILVVVVVVVVVCVCVCFICFLLLYFFHDVLYVFFLSSNSPGPREIPGCTGSCQLTYCRACYFSPHPLPLPGNCKQCDLANYRSNTPCFRQWSKCIQKAHFKENGWVSHSLFGE